MPTDRDESAAGFARTDRDYLREMELIAGGVRENFVGGSDRERMHHQLAAYLERAIKAPVRRVFSPLKLSVHGLVFSIHGRSSAITSSACATLSRLSTIATPSRLRASATCSPLIVFGKCWISIVILLCRPPIRLDSRTRFARFRLSPALPNRSAINAWTTRRTLRARSASSASGCVSRSISNPRTTSIIVRAASNGRGAPSSFRRRRQPRFHPSFIGIEVARYFRIPAPRKGSARIRSGPSPDRSRIPDAQPRGPGDPTGCAVRPPFSFEFGHKASRFRQVESERLAHQLLARSEIVG